MGRYKKVRFPIRRTEVYHGRDIERTVEEHTTVRCWMCGETFLINSDTVYIQPDAVGSDIEMVRCPQCNARASIYHYYDRTVSGKSRRS